MRTTKTNKRNLSYSLKAKVSLLCTVFILIATNVNYTLLINVSKETITTNTELTMKDLATAYGKNVSDAILSISESANFLMQSEAIVSYLETQESEEDEEIQNFISMYLKMNDAYEAVSLVDKNGIILSSSNSSLIGDDLSNESYFLNTMTNSISSVSDVFLLESSGEACVTFSIPLRNINHSEEMVDSIPDGENEAGFPLTNEFSGAITFTVHVSEFSSILSDISVAGHETGYAYLLDSKGTVVYHPNEELIGTNLNIDVLNSLVDQVQEGIIPDPDIISYTYMDENKYASYSVDSSSQWILVITANQADVLSSLNNVTTKSFTLSILLTAVLSILAYIFAGTISKPIKQLTKFIEQTAKLDFTTDSYYYKLSRKRDETGEMSRALEVMRGELKSMIQQIGNASTHISESADSLSLITQSVNDHALENSATAEELSASMEETAATTDYICTTIDNISNHSKEINNKALAGSSLSLNLIERASKLRLSTITATKNTQKIYAEVKEKTTHAIEQAKAVDKINSLTNVIKEIANQTSLLALNAAIEAARAGESGRGFSVVASEIGSLAEQSSNTVSGINDIISEVHLAVNNLTGSLELTLNFLEVSVLADYEAFLQASDQYNSDANNMSGVLDSIHNGIDSLNTNLLHITDSITEINSMIGEASKGIIDVSEKNSDIVNMTTGTHNMVLDNKGYSTDLIGIVDKFKL